MRVAVVGAGLAGLAAGCELADLGHEVRVFEKRPWAGGKTYSRLDPESGGVVDNGQHVFMACTTEYVAFLRRLGTLGLTRRQRRLRVPVFDAAGRRSEIRAARLPAPMHLAGSFALYGHLGLRDKLAVARLMASIERMPPARRDEFRDESFGDWLRARGQSENSIRDLWDLLVLPTLNCRSEKASAADALFVLQEGFLKSSTSAAIGIPAAGLSDLHVGPAVRRIEARGGGVCLKSAVKSLEIEGDTVRSLATARGRESFDACVLATPHREVGALLPAAVTAEEPFASLRAIRTSPIVNVHLWFDRPVAPFAFAAFVGCDLQWVFNRNRIERTPSRAGEHLVVSLSGADAYLGLTKPALKDLLLPQLQRALPLARNTGLVRYSVIKEPEATFLPAPGLRRPGPQTPLRNLVLAGAYTATGWPATMESAVRSGLAAARRLHASSRATQLAASPE